MARHRRPRKKVLIILKKLPRWVLIPIILSLNFEATIHVKTSATLRADIPTQTIVMAGLVPAIYALDSPQQGKTWMPATSAGMTTLL
jgi:hypothetical protein